MKPRLTRLLVAARGVIEKRPDEVITRSDPTTADLGLTHQSLTYPTSRFRSLACRVLLIVMLALAPCQLFTGCAGPERTVLNTVIASRMTVGEALEIFKAQVRTGKVDKATFDKAKLALETYKKASTSALKALKTYEATGDQDAWLKASTISAQASSDLINILAPFVPGLR